MKKITLLLMLMVASLSFGQLKRVDTSEFKGEEEIGKFETGGKLFMKITKTDNVYTFTYQNVEIKTLESLNSFKLEDTGSDFETLYSMIKEGFATPPSESIMLDLKDHFLWLDFGKNYGQTVVRFSSTPKVMNHTTLSWEFTQKQVDQIFGKAESKKKKKK